MSIFRAGLVIAVIFAFSPVRDGAGTMPAPSPDPVAAIPIAVPPDGDPQTIAALIRRSAELETEVAHAHEAWRALPAEAQDALAGMLAEELLRSSIYMPDR